jgi:hypothetical protein
LLEDEEEEEEEEQVDIDGGMHTGKLITDELPSESACTVTATLVAGTALLEKPVLYTSILRYHFLPIIVPS